MHNTQIDRTILRKEGWLLSKIRVDEQTTHDVMAAVQCNGANLQYAHVQTQEIVDTAIENNPVAYRYAMDEHKNAKNTLSAVLLHPYSLVYAPAHLVTDDLVALALSVSEMDWAAIPKSHLNDQRVAECLRHRLDNGLSFLVQDLARYTLPHDLQIRMVENKGDYLQYIKEPCLEAIYAALRHFGGAIKHIPQESQTFAMAEIAAQQPGNLKFVNPALRAEQVCASALAKHGLDLMYVPDAQMSYELCLIAVSKTGTAIRIVPEHMQTPELRMTAITNDGMAIGFLRNHTPEERMAALTSNALAIDKIKAPLSREELVALIGTGQAAFLPSDLPDDLQVMACKARPVALHSFDNPCLAAMEAAVEANGQMIGAVPRHRQTKKMQMAAAQQDGSLVRFMKNPSHDVINAAMAQNPNAMRHLKRPVYF